MSRQVLRLARAEIGSFWYIPLLLISLTLYVVVTHISFFLPGEHAEMSRLPNSVFMVVFAACALSGHLLAPWYMRAGQTKEETLAFYLTRPVLRRLILRSKTLVLLLPAVLPLLLFLPLSLLKPDASFRLYDGQHTGDKVSVERYVEAFPDSVVIRSEHRSSAKLQIPHAWPYLVGWSLVFSFATIVLCQLSCSVCWKFKNAKPGGYVAFWIYLPQFLVAVAWFVLPMWQPGFYTECFLFFAKNLVPVVLGVLMFAVLSQLIVERRFEKLEGV